VSAPLLDSPANILRQLLVDLALAAEPSFNGDGRYTGGAWPAFANTLPPMPDQLLCVTATDDQDDGGDMHGNLYFHYACQIRARGANETTTKLKAYAVQVALFQPSNVQRRTVTVGANNYEVWCVIPGPVLNIGMGVPNDKRFNSTCNVKMPIRIL